MTEGTDRCPVSSTTRRRGCRDNPMHPFGHPYAGGDGSDHSKRVSCEPPSEPPSPGYLGSRPETGWTAARPAGVPSGNARPARAPHLPACPVRHRLRPRVVLDTPTDPAEAVSGCPPLGVTLSSSVGHRPRVVASRLPGSSVVRGGTGRRPLRDQGERTAPGTWLLTAGTLSAPADRGGGPRDGH